MNRHIKVLITLILLLVTSLGCIIYVGDYYHTDGEALLEFTESCSADLKIDITDDMIITRAENPIAGFIFYPGGKVEFSAYLPLMLRLAERGITSVILKMPFNLAILDVKAADGVRELLPEIDRWYIGGHSLGGSMAASYLSATGGFDGLILLASYSTSDVSGYPVLSIYGSNDRVMNREKYDKYMVNLPTDLNEKVIEGGNHASFGIYGHQDGDGDLSIKGSEQIEITANLIFDFIK